LQIVASPGSLLQRRWKHEAQGTRQTGRQSRNENNRRNSQQLATRNLEITSCILKLGIACVSIVLFFTFFKIRFLFHLLTLCAFLIVVLRRKRAQYHFIHGSTTIIMVEEIKVNDCVAVNGGIYVGQCGKVIGVLECMYRIVLDGYEVVVV
jgi:hypothetical protein